jgi:hypothetical protein
MEVGSQPPLKLVPLATKRLLSDLPSHQLTPVDSQPIKRHLSHLPKPPADSSQQRGFSAIF